MKTIIQDQFNSNPHRNELSTTSLMDVDMAQALQDGLNKAETIDAAETKRLEDAKSKAPVSTRK